MKRIFRKYSDFTQLFRRDITLRMRLDPVKYENEEITFLEKSAVEIKDEHGKTKLMTKDEEYYQDYKKLKPIFDKYHQYNIQKSLDAFVKYEQKEYQDYLNNQKENQDVPEGEQKNEPFIHLVCTFAEHYNKKKEKDENKEDERQREIGEILNKLCTKISDFFKDDTKNQYFTKTIAKSNTEEKEFGHKDLFSKDFIVSELVKFAKETEVLSPEEIVHVNHIQTQAIRMTQYCDKLFTSRKNVYEKKKNSVAYRCVYENLKLFLSICNKAKKVCKELGQEEYLAKVFTPAMYCNYLSQVGIDNFNSVISSLNTIINQYNLNLPKEEKKEKKLYKLKKLKKQILSDKESVIDIIADDRELIEKIQFVVNKLEELGIIGEGNNRVKRLLDNLGEYDLTQIYLNSNNLYPVSAALFNDGMKLKNMVEWRKDNIPKTKVVSIQEINQYINEELESDIDVCTYFKDLKTKNAEDEKLENIFELIQKSFNDYSKQDAETFTGAKKTEFKRMMDVVITLNRSLKSLSYSEDNSEYDDTFYEEYGQIIEELKEIDHAYNLIRNYVLRSKNGVERFPLYFDQSAENFLKAFTIVKNHGTKSKGYLFRKRVRRIDGQESYDYYLGISKSPSLFAKRGSTVKQKNDSDVQRLTYYQTKKQTFRGNQFESVNKEKISKFENKLYTEVLDIVKENERLHSHIYDKGELKKDAKSIKGLVGIVKKIQPDFLDYIMSKEDVKSADEELSKRLIETAHSIVQIIELKKYKPTAGLYSWEIKDELMDIVSTRKAKSYEWVDKTDLANATKDFNSPDFLHLFRITNKDLNYFVPNKIRIGKIQRKDEPLRKSHGRENLHTLFFRSMMSEDESVFDLGSGKIMYRRASVDLKETHKPGKLKNKNKRNTNKESTFEYSLYKDKRFTRDQMTLHLSMTQNYKVPNTSDVKQINEAVREYLTTTKEKYNIIGIDRGERNLLYVTLMKSDGTIIRQKSLNNITDEQHNINTDYHQLLKEKVDKIKQQKANWEDIDRISTVKEGYLSQAVHEIAKMAVENKAIIVMEKLSEGFKSARQKYLSNVYQKFESMLVRKLAFYTDKTLDKNAPGGILNALQLTAMDSVELNKNDYDVVQNGIIFFVPAWMTSKIDPVTGFVNLFQFGRIKTLTDARKMLSEFSAIRYDKKKKEFVFSFSYSDFDISYDSVNEWAIGTHGNRIVFFRDENGYPSRKHIVLTDEFMTFFKKYDIEISEEMKNTICNYNVAEHPSISQELKELGNKGFFEELFRNIRYIVQLRNSDPDAKDEKDKDYIISPVTKADGKYYLSSKYQNADSPERQEKAKLPVDSDANGAYNIARKGIIVLEQIRKRKKTIKISEEDWLAFAQKSYKSSLE